MGWHELPMDPGPSGTVETGDLAHGSGRTCKKEKGDENEQGRTNYLVY